jgi:polysaccharide biosynthesis transport protein
MNEIIVPGSQDTPMVQGPFPEEEDVPALLRVIGVVRSKWRLGLSVAAIVFAGVLGASSLIPQSQYAEATLIIHPASGNLTESGDAQSAPAPDTSAVDTEVEVIRSPAVAEAVARKLELYKDSAFGGSAAATPSDELMRRVVSAVEANSRIRRIGLTYVVQVGFLASTTARAKWIADEIIDTYMARKLNGKLTAVARADRELDATLGGLRDQAVQAESRVEDYEAQTNLLGANGTSLTETELSALNQKIADAQADSAEKYARLGAALSQARSGGGGADVGATLASNTIASLRQKEADVSANVAQLNIQFRPDYPAVKKAQAELQDIRNQLKSETDRILSSLRAEADVAGRREASLLVSRQETEAKLVANNRSRVGLLTLQQAADSSKKIYETYLTRASEVSAARSLQQVDATVESRAIAAPASLFMSMRFILAVGFVLATIAGFFAIIVSEISNRGIRSRRDLMRVTGVPLAGVFPHVRALRRGRRPAAYIIRRPLSVPAEAFRSLRAHLAFALPDDKSQIIAVTSAVPGEGKTLTSICLARTYAAIGSQVVLLDCDLRRARASRFFAKPKFGVAEIVAQSATIDEALIHDSKSGIWFLAGSTTKNISGDVFGNDRIDELLRELAKRFDKIIIDTPPLLGFAEARILASKADCVLHVVRWDSTPASTVHAAVRILRQSNARLAGTVLNRVNMRRQAQYGFADGSDYYHRYGATY